MPEQYARPADTFEQEHSSNTFSKPLIELKQVTKTFRGIKILDSLDLKVYKSESLVVLGRSGTGKSVLLKVIMRLLEADSGEVILNSSELNQAQGQATQGQEYVGRFGFLFQNGALFDSLPIWENITFYLIHNQNITDKDAKKRAASLLERVGLDSKIVDLYPSELSGGMQKRVALARSIAHSPQILLLDEPTSGLDPVTTRSINDLINKLHIEDRYTIVTVTHDIQSASHIADRIVILQDGKIAWSGSPQQMMASSDPIPSSFAGSQSIRSITPTT